MTVHIIDPDDGKAYITSDTDDGFVDRIYPEARNRFPWRDRKAECRIRLVG